MKRLIAAVLLLAAAASICFFGTFMLKKECSKMTYILNEASEMTFKENAFDKIKEINPQIKSQWEHSHSILAKIVMHIDLEPIEEDVSQLESCIVNKDLPKYRELCMDASEHLKHLKDSEKISLENIF